MPVSLPQNLHRVFYVSRCLANPLEVQAILTASRQHNAMRGVTGALLFTGGCFAQVLEGEEGVLQTTMAAILADPRHDQVQNLLQGEAADRRFAAWSMAYSESSGADDLLSQLVRGAAIDPARAERLMTQLFANIT